MLPVRFGYFMKRCYYETGGRRSHPPICFPALQPDFPLSPIGHEALYSPNPICISYPIARLLAYDRVIASSNFKPLVSRPIYLFSEMDGWNEHTGRAACSSGHAANSCTESLPALVLDDNALAIPRSSVQTGGPSGLRETVRLQIRHRYYAEGM